MKTRVLLLSIVFLVIVLVTSCSPELQDVDETKVQQLNYKEEVADLEKNTNTVIKYQLEYKQITPIEFEKWVKNSYEGYYDSDKYSYSEPLIEDFDYPYIILEGNDVLQNSINDTIKNAVFSDVFLSHPMLSLAVSSTPWSEVEFPGIVEMDTIVSIPMVYTWDRQKLYYKSFSITLDLETGERLFLDDLIEVDEKLANSFLREEGFYKDYELVLISISKTLENESVESILKILSETDEYYLTKEGIVLTHYANKSSVPIEFYIPIEKLEGYLLIDSWK